jgi:hypothetical protein
LRAPGEEAAYRAMAISRSPVCALCLLHWRLWLLQLGSGFELEQSDHTSVPCGRGGHVWLYLRVVWFSFFFFFCAFGLGRILVCTQTKPLRSLAAPHSWPRVVGIRSNIEGTQTRSLLAEFHITILSYLPASSSALYVLQILVVG